MHSIYETKKGNEKVYADLDDKIDGLKTTATEITKKISEDLDVAYKSQQKLEAETQLFQLILTDLVAVL